MIRWMRTARINDGKFMLAMGWSKEMSAYAEKKFGINKLNVYVDAFGEMGLVRWSCEFTDLAALDKAQTALMMDQDYWARISQAYEQGLFVPNTTNDVVLREI